MKRVLLAMCIAATGPVQGLFAAPDGPPQVSPVTAPVSAGYCVYYWCTGEWHTYATYGTHCEANRVARNLQAQGYPTKIVSHY